MIVKTKEQKKMSKHPNNTLVPIVVEKDPSGIERSYDIYSRLLKERIIFVTGGIDTAMANTIIAQMLYLQSEDKNKDINLYINSPGGSVYAGLAIYDTMRHLSCDISTIAVGSAASMGAILLSGGTKGKRFALPHANILIHQPLGGAEGQASDIEITANEILRIKKELLEILATNSGKSLKKVEADADRDFFMTATQAKDYGLIDKVLK